MLTVPPNPDNRYYTLQLIDFYSDTVGYIGQRATKNIPGDYLVAGPGWKGEAPEGIKDALTAMIAEAYTGSIGPAATGMRTETITIADGLMTVTGRIK